ncbi:hypothetical protein GmHk_08G023636 [Glycine max]|nr:uncharacterized protein LOC102668895 [Glycine max]KAG5017219.1 hypothetical protein JHK85_023355 [Glycine max]KAG5026975.1 hypothetical protein JHK86_022889 [Glycine max]KAH1239133.1 hypothetical protein GmHk_08G023636 [Glycine max]|eukprot:XP_006586544.1 uncharacterized protein LOC102668895 [Glycine max]
MNNMQNKTSSIKKLKMHALSILRMSHLFHKSNDVAPIPSMLNQNFISENQIQIDKEENFEEQQEFSFPNFCAQGTFTFADDIFDNGKIRPKSTTFDQSLIFTIVQDNDTLHLQPPLKKLFVDKELNGFSSQSKGTSKGSCNETSQKMTMVEVLTLNNQCKKSKSTGFSNTWRLREDIKLRSISDGKDAFVLLNPSGSMPMKSNEAKEEIVVSKRKKGEKRKTTFSPHEKIYVMNKKRKETNKRKSFLPYRQNLIGVFANVNGFSRILSPF